MPKRKINPWDRQEGESEKAYEAFVIYRDMGSERSQTAVSKELSKSRHLIGRWSSRWNWQDRVFAYDNELQKEAKAEAVKELKDMTKRHIGIAITLQKKALEALKELDTKDMTPRDIREYIKMATDLERLNREFTDIQNQEQEENDDDNVLAFINAMKNGGEVL